MLRSQEKQHEPKEKDNFYFFTSNLLFVPTEASIFESRVGVTRYIDSKNLQLDIGASFDLIGYKASLTTFSFGVDFFTFSNLRSESNFKFPVDAIDYFFGVNFNFRNKDDLSGRLRISHISSHFEDGHVYERSDTIFTPYVFSKEFINFAIMKDLFPSDNTELKALAAVNYNFHGIPESISKVSGQFGLEGRYYFTKILSCYVSNDLSVASVNSKTNLNENLEAGVTLGSRGSRSVNIYFDYYDGQDYRGQYYGEYLNYKGIGLRFKF